MLRRTDELEVFKTQINLSEYAAALGYALDRKSSSRNSAIMRDGAGDKVVIARGFDRHWIYFSVRDDRDNGSIIDFVQKRKGGSLGEVRKELRPWIDGMMASATPRPETALFVATLEPISKDLAFVRARYEGMQPVEGHHPYLENERKIPAQVLVNPKFSERIRTDERHNAIFPHFNREGLCGYEIKNHGFTGFAKGGEKGLWHSRAGEADRALVIAETAIDALSYAALKGVEDTRFFSIGGEMNPSQPGLIKSAIEKMPGGSRIVLAVDNDQGGEGLAAKIHGVFADSSHSGCVLVDERPQGSAKDWNDVLRASTGEIERFLLAP